MKLNNTQSSPNFKARVTIWNPMNQYHMAIQERLIRGIRRGCNIRKIPFTYGATQVVNKAGRRDHVFCIPIIFDEKDSPAFRAIAKGAQNAMDFVPPTEEALYARDVVDAIEQDRFDFSKGEILKAPSKLGIRVRLRAAAYDLLHRADRPSSSAT